jgi:hypothetical protein
LTSARLVFGNVNLGLNDISSSDQVFDSNCGGLRIPEDLDWRLFLPSGVLFVREIDGELATLNCVRGCHRKVSMVIYRKPGDRRWLDDPVDEISLDSERMRFLLSPIWETTEIGYERIAALLRCLQGSGYQADKFVGAVAACTDFAPLVTVVSRLCEGETVDGWMVMIESMGLMAVFLQILPKDFPKQWVFEYAPNCGCWIVHLGVGVRG